MLSSNKITKSTAMKNEWKEKTHLEHMLLKTTKKSVRDMHMYVLLWKLPNEVNKWTCSSFVKSEPFSCSISRSTNSRTQCPKKIKYSCDEFFSPHREQHQPSSSQTSLRPSKLFSRNTPYVYFFKPSTLFMLEI